MTGEAIWLARWSMRRAWWSYPLTALIWAIPGFFAWTLMSDDLLGGELADALAADIFFFAICTGMTWNYGALTNWQMTSSQTIGRLSFHRSLPIRIPDLIVGRALFVIPALLANSVAFFGVPYMISAIISGSLARHVDVGSYIWFALMWIGYALMYSGVHIHGEFAVRALRYNLTLVIATIPVMVAIAVAHLVYGVGLVVVLLGLAGTHGPLGAAVALVVGLAVASVSMAATVRRVRRRDVVA